MDYPFGLGANGKMCPISRELQCSVICAARGKSTQQVEGNWPRFKTHVIE